MKRSIAIQPALAAYGFASWHGAPVVMPQTHRHNEVEFNFVERGALAYRFGATATVLHAGQLALFWAAMPHRCYHADPATSYYCFTVPLGWFLQQPLPPMLIRQVLDGMFVRDNTTATPIDVLLFAQWHADLASSDAERRAIVLLELQARLRRVALRHTTHIAPTGEKRAGDSHGGSIALAHAEQIARLIVARSTEPLPIRDIAAAIGLHPNYAMKVFHETYGVSIGAYLTQYRVAQAQRLLVLTDLPVLEIALQVGFGSPSRFYAAFKEACGMAPRAYRIALHTPTALQR